jgi:Xaa-Pro aminopeptidase
MDFGALVWRVCRRPDAHRSGKRKFTQRQKEVYNACLHLHNFAKSILKPGISIIDYTDKVGEEATQQFLKIGLLQQSDVANEDRENRAYRKYLYHGISHHLGIDVHDLGTRTEPVNRACCLR